MTSPCEQYRLRMMAERAIDRPWPVAVEQHLEGCDVCAGLVQRWVRLERSLAVTSAASASSESSNLGSLHADDLEAALRVGRSLCLLEAVSAPATLEGRVVGAMQDGFRQDRAASRVSQLGALAAPKALDDRIATVLSQLRAEGHLPQGKAPAELEQRVDEDLRDLPATISRVAAAKLPRLQAPIELGRRVQGRFEAPLQKSKIQSFQIGGVALRPRLLVASLVAAAGLLIWAGITYPSSTSRAPEPNWAFQVEHTQRLEALSPRAIELGLSVTPGLRALLLGNGPASLDATDLGAASSGSQRVPVTLQPTNQATPPFAGVNSSQGAVGQIGGTTSGNAPATLGNGSGSGPSGVSVPAGGTASTSAPALPRFGPDYLNDTIDAPFTVAYRGNRRVHTRTMQGDQMFELDYREEVASDGQGNFTIVPRWVFVPTMAPADQNQFLLQQSKREGFFYRFRDFRIRNLEDFWRNYDVQHLSKTIDCAGRTCERFDIQRKDGTGNSYRVSIDPLTSLVLAEECLDPNGQLIRETWFETFALDADLSDLQLTGGPSLWTEFDPQLSAGIFNQELLIPTAPPTGYETQSVAYQASAGLNGLAWARFVYGDGVERVFFMHEDGQPVASGSSSGMPAVANSAAGDLVRVFSFGPWTIVEGDIAGRYMFAIGKVHEQELLLMLQSAVE